MAETIMGKTPPKQDVMQNIKRISRRLNGTSRHDRTTMYLRLLEECLNNGNNHHMAYVPGFLEKLFEMNPEYQSIWKKLKWMRANQRFAWRKEAFDLPEPFDLF